MAKKRAISAKEKQEQGVHQDTAMKVIVIFIIIVVAYLTVMSINTYCGLKPDNIFEESIEAAVQTTTGVSVDLSPDSPE